MPHASGQVDVVVVNGGSSSGKTSLCRALQEALPGLWLTFGVDALVDALPGGGDSPRADITFAPDGTVSVGPDFTAGQDAWYAGLAAMAHHGARLVLDEVLLAGGAGQERVRRALDGLDVVWVGVRCDPDVAAAREAQRPDRTPGMARAQALSVHAGVRYDLEVDTTRRPTPDCAAEIAAALAARTAARG
ncbi:chloramphenicol phosphotransferase CPT family protein [Cellulomonas fimi]|uniref:chloramphenicol phosphotransferase CPT family protein n=1 Tax=Cellulomonas fimi TaxID=1708 RepID=UPI00235881AB|nr:chloramphenicol phosphotransferase [Cellulomonas fimi]